MVDIVKQNGDQKGSFGAEGGAKQPRREAKPVSESAHLRALRARRAL